jgi:hypothetical protein
LGPRDRLEGKTRRREACKRGGGAHASLFVRSLARFDTKPAAHSQKFKRITPQAFLFSEYGISVMYVLLGDLSPPRPGEGFVGEPETRRAGAEDRPRAKGETREVFLFGFTVTH